MDAGRLATLSNPFKEVNCSSWKARMKLKVKVNLKTNVKLKVEIESESERIFFAYEPISGWWRAACIFEQHDKSLFFLPKFCEQLMGDNPAKLAILRGRLCPGCHYRVQILISKVSLAGQSRWMGFSTITLKEHTRWSLSRIIHKDHSQRSFFESMKASRTLHYKGNRIPRLVSEQLLH